MDVVNTAAELLVPEHERAVLRRMNRTDDATPETIGERFLDVAARHAEQAAVLAARRDLTYRELCAAATALAGHLRRSPGGAPVAVCLEPGWETPVAVLAAALAGVGWIALDPGAPRSAHWQRIAQLGADTVLTQSWLDQRLEWPAGTTVILVDPAVVDPAVDGVAVDGVAVPAPLRQAAEPQDVACHLQEPSGLVAVTHDGVTGPLADLAAQLGLGTADRVLAVCPLGDAMSAAQLYTALLTGGAVVIPDDIDLRTPAAWVSLLRAHRVTVWHSPPALAVQLVEHLLRRGDDFPDDLRAAVLGTEPLQLGLVRWLRRATGPGLRVLNVEPGGRAGLWVAAHEVGAEPDPRRGHLPAGVPLAGRRVHVLGESGSACPVWVPGRLHVGARGLHPVPDGARVVPAPEGGEPVFRTGRSARVVVGGLLDVLGDDTTQITVSGHPLNLRDVEAAVATHEDVLAAAVVPAGDGSVAFVRSAPGRHLTGAAVLDHLRTRMSPYLLPARVELVGAFPLTPGGQVDRAALTRQVAPAPAPIAGPPTAPARGAAPPELVRRACELAARILGVADVEPDLNLLDVGASSVQLVQLAVQAENELGIEPDVEELLRFPSVGVLVSFAAGSETDRTPVAGDPGTAAELMLDPVQRQVFTDARPGLRHDLAAAAGVALPPTAVPDLAVLARRRTHRRFTARPVPAAALAALLGATRRVDGAADGGAGPRHAYPSAGNLYPVQIFVTVAAGRVDGVAEGSYYYHPDQHRLVGVHAGAAPGPAVHAWVNREVYRASAFSLHLVAHLPAIAPLYGARSRDYCLIEAGAMGQLLMTVAADAGLGLCPVGDLDRAAAGAPLQLRPGDEIAHTLLGGVPEGAPDDQSAMLDRLRRFGRGGGR